MDYRAIYRAILQSKLYRELDNLTKKYENTTGPNKLKELEQRIEEIGRDLGRIHGSKTRKSKAPVIGPISNRKR